jgi:hypothetical protein
LADARANPNLIQRRTSELRLVRTWIEKKLWQDEPDLQELAFVQYRYMTPLARTEAFTQLYYEIYIAAYAKQFPDEDVSQKRPIDPDFARNDLGVMNALWTARAWADAQGIPYDVYLEAIITGHMVNDRWQQPPRPNQLYGKLARPRVRDLPSPKQIAERLYGEDWDRRFFAAAYRGDPVQDAAIALLRGIVLGSDDPAATLSKYLCARQAITLEAAEATFGSELVASAVAAGSSLPAESQADDRRFIPSCFGHPNPSEDTPCPTCPVNRQCLSFSDLVRDELVSVTGSDDPRKEWKKQVNRERQRRWRKGQRPLSAEDEMLSLLGEHARRKNAET